MKIVLAKTQEISALHTLKGNAGNDNRALGLYAAATWQKLYTPYVPMQSGVLFSSVTIEPWKITHNAPYAARQYYGNFNFSRDYHPFATGGWDQAAISAGKVQSLANSVQAYIRSGKAGV